MSRRLHVEESAVLIDGPWTHRDVSANGIRLHVVEAGGGPLVILLHGFPGFWWSWRHQLATLAGAGFRAVACDLRGYGASDKPPRGYDPMTAAADVAGLVRALGEDRAVLVGQDWGAHIAWTTAALHPTVGSAPPVSTWPGFSCPGIRSDGLLPTERPTWPCCCVAGSDPATRSAMTNAATETRC